MDVRRGEVRTPRPLTGPRKATRSGQSERVRRMNNANAPVNTLDRPPVTNPPRLPRASLSSTDSAFVGGSKRLQDYDRESAPENRASKRLRPNPTPTTRDAVRLSQDDAESVDKSTASNDDRRPKQTNQIRQPEFRNSSIGTPKSRRRRNRKRPAGARERRGSESAQRNLEFRKSMSPDELQNSSPPLVESDLLPPRASALPKSSRPVQSHPGSALLPFEAAKHRRKNGSIEEISDDELADDGTKQGGRRKPQTSSNSTKCRPARRDSKIRICQAVSGRHTFQPEKDVELVRHDSGTAWRLATGDGKSIGHPWLRLDVGRMNKIYHAPDSEIVVIYRPQVSDSQKIPTMLVLEFEHEQASCQFIREVKMAPATVKFEEKSPEHLTKLYERRLDDARQRYSREHPDNPTLGDGAEPASFDVTLSYPGDETQSGEATGKRQAPKTRLIDCLSAGAGQNSVSKRSSSPPSKPPAMPRTRRATRQSAPEGLFEDEDPLLPRWSLENTAWKKYWDRELVYPSTGRNRATVHKEDIHRLDEGAFLNDSVVFCYLRYLQVEMERERPDIAKRIYFMNTYFFEILRKAKGGLINYEGVKSWTSKVDIFSYDYIVVPVNEEAHWYLAIICNPRVAIKGDQDTDDDDVVFLDSRKDAHRDPLASPRTRRRNETGSQRSPLSLTKSLQMREKGRPETVGKVNSKDIRIITLDSLGASHSKTCQMLRKYLVEEAKSRKNLDAPELDRKIGLTAKHIPAQANFCDCGVFLLGYAQQFLEDPDGFVATILQRGKPEWTVNASQLRNQVRETLFHLHKEYREELAERKLKKRKNRLGGPKRAGLSTGSSDDPVSEAQDRQSSVLDERDPQNPQRTRDRDTPSTPAREQVSGDCPVEPGLVNEEAEGWTGPRNSPQPTAPAEKSKAISSPQTGTQSQNDSGSANTSRDAERWEEATKIRQSIEHDGDQSPSSSGNTSSSPNLSSTRGQADQPDDIVHSPAVPSPPNTNRYLKKSIEQQDDAFASEPRLMKLLSVSPRSSTRSAVSPVLEETSPPKRRAKAIDIENDDEAACASKRKKETGAKSEYFGGGDEGTMSFVPRYDTRVLRPKESFEHGRPRKGGQGGRLSDAIDLTE